MKDRLKKVKALVLDVDGVLTEGGIIYDSEGREIKVFDVRDGFGIVVLRKAGLKTAIISARPSKAVLVRAEDLGIDKVYVNAYPKLKAYEEILKEFGVSDDEVCYVGDDLPDLAIMKRVGVPVTVCEAVNEVKDVALYVTEKRGGHGAVREVVELILSAQGKWGQIVEQHS